MEHVRSFPDASESAVRSGQNSSDDEENSGCDLGLSNGHSDLEKASATKSLEEVRRSLSK